jgi:hypothetical protein
MLHLNVKPSPTTIGEVQHQFFAISEFLAAGLKRYFRDGSQASSGKNGYVAS